MVLPSLFLVLIILEKYRIIIDPTHYTVKILKAFSHFVAKPLSTPGIKGEYIVDNKRESPPLNKEGHRAYRRLVGQCLWLSSVRRDIAYAVKELSKFVHAPTQEDRTRGQHLLRYLVGTKDENSPSLPH